MKIASSIVAGFFAGFLLVACTGDSDAGSNNPPTGNSGDTVSLADFNALKAEVAALQLTVTELRKSVTVAVGRPEATATLMAKTANGDEPQEVGIGCAPSGYLPATQFTAEYIQCTTPQGFYVNVPKEGGPPRKMEPRYETADCTGTPWLPRGTVSGALRNGAVFAYEDAIGDHVGYIPPNPEQRTVTVQTVYNFEEEKCEPFGATIVMNNMIEVLPHEVGADGFNSTTGARNDYPPTTTTVQQ